MPAKVVDASVVGAWCFGESRAAEAFLIIRESDLHAPLLLAYELTSIARKKATLYPQNTGQIEHALRIALSLPIHWVDVDYLTVLQLALSANLTTYDACYLYVARKTGLSLATFDDRLGKASIEHTRE